MFRQTVFACLAAATATLVSVQPSTAADGKTYPASICRYWTAPENANRGRMRVSQFGRIGNAGGANRRLGVVCPVLRDSQRSGIERVLVRGIHRNCTNNGGRNQPCPGNTEFTFRVMALNGDNLRSIRGPTQMLRADNSQQQTASTVWGRTNVSVPDFTDATSISQGSSFVLFCRLAPAAELSSIYIGEGTD